jgi:lysyl-tRNA synthetase class 2
MDAERLNKLNQIKELGVHPYPEKYLERTSSKEAKELGKTEHREISDIESTPAKKIRLAGRMMLFRSMGKLSFGQVQDFEGRFQFCFKDGYTKVTDLDETKMSHRKFWEKMLDLGDYIGVEGELFITKHGEPTVYVSQLTFLGKALRPMPEKFAGVADDEIKLRQRYLETITSEETRKRLKLRSDVIKTIRQFMWDHDFMEVETPILEHEATGAAARPYYTHNNALDIDLVLRISQELPHKQIIVGGYEKIFEIGKAFRNEGVDPSHLPEHTHFEWYAAYWSFEENMQFMEKMYKHVFEKLELNPVIKVKDRNGEEVEIDFSKEWERIDYVKQLEADSGINIMEVKDVETLRSKLKEKKIFIDGMDEMGYATLVDYMYKKVSRPKIVGPAFLYNYPKSMKPLARSNDINPEMTDTFQLVVNGWELCNAFSELVDPIEQKKRFEEQAVGVEAGDEEAFRGDDDYITAMEYGMPPISGVGPGLDRFITLLTEQENLRDCIFFPLMRPKNK